MSRVAACAAVCALLCTTTVDAHVGPLRGTAPFIVDDEIVGGATTWGIVLVEEDRALRVCEEAVGEVTAFHLLLDDGRILIGAESALFTTDDGGCTYEALPVVIEGLPFVSAARSRAAPVIVVASTTALARSNDGGATFAALAPLEGAPILREVIVDDTGERIVASGFEPTTGAPVLIRSDDAGATFARTTVDGYARLIALSFDGDRALASAIAATGGSTLVSFDDTFTMETLGAFDGVVTDAVAYEGVRAVIVDKQAYFEERTMGTFTEILGGPTGCLARAPASSTIFGCARFADLVHFLSSDEEGVFIGAIPYGLVEERACPLGTPGRARCALVDAGAPDGGQDQRDAGEDAGSVDGGEGTPPTLCTCGSAIADGDDASVAALCTGTSLLAIGLRRRRGHRSKSAHWSRSVANGMVEEKAP